MDVGDKFFRSIAKFNSTCMKCNKPIKVGQKYIFRKRPKTVYCEECVKGMTITIYNSKSVKGNGTECPAPKPKEPQTKEDFMKQLESDVKELMEKAVSEKKDSLESEAKEMLETAKEQFKKEIEKEFGSIPKQIIEIKKPDGTKTEIKEAVNSVFSNVVSMVAANIPVFLTGGAGCGKNHLVKKVAETLKLDFYFSNAITNEFKITGYKDASGVYHETQFYEAFTKGGIFFFDEVDASIPEILVLLNAAIENKYFNFPNGRADAHPDFRVIAAGNTFGTGADLLYVGRYQLDAASLDRFVLVKMDYQPEVENLLAGGDLEIVEAVRKIREIAKKNEIKIVMSYRAIRQLYVLVHGCDMLVDAAVKCVLIKGINVDDLAIISGDIPETTNRYLNSFRGLSNVQE